MTQDSQRKTLDRALSRAGVCSRGDALKLIEAGRVLVNGVTAKRADLWVDARRDQIAVDGLRLNPKERMYLALNKPKGVLTSHGDPRERRTVYELLADLDVWVVPVGRLDRDTTGLLLFTNDTDWAERIASPELHVPKTYRVQAAPRLDESALERLRAGLLLDDGPTRPALVEHVRHVGATTLLELTISEGRNRQVRRMLREVGARVRALKRIAIGALQLGDLPSGTWRRLSPAELESLPRATARKQSAAKPGARRVPKRAR
jgi:pseudouridine synthase